MEQRHKDNLRSNRTFLIANLDYMKLRDVLKEEGLIDDDKDELIQYEKTTKDKMRRLLDEIPRMGKRAYPILMKSIGSCGKIYHHVLEQLQEPIPVESKSANLRGPGFLESLENRYPGKSSYRLTEQNASTLIGDLMASDIPSIDTLARCLGINKYKIDQIRNENQYNTAGQLSDVLSHWMQVQSGSSTIKNLVSAYEKAKLPGLIYEKQILAFVALLSGENYQDREASMSFDNEKEEAMEFSYRYYEPPPEYEVSLKGANSAYDGNISVSSSEHSLHERLSVVESKTGILWNDWEQVNAPLDKEQIQLPVLKQHYDDLIEYLRPENIVTELYSKMIITMDEKQMIEKDTTTSNKNKRILYCVNKNGENGLNEFITCLEQSPQKEIADILKKAMMRLC